MQDLDGNDIWDGKLPLDSIEDAQALSNGYVIAGYSKAQVDSDSATGTVLVVDRRGRVIKRQELPHFKRAIFNHIEKLIAADGGGKPSKMAISVEK